MDVEILCETLELPQDVRDKLYMIANNYFVFQPTTNENSEVLKIILHKLTHSLLLTHYQEHNDIDLLHERMSLFIDDIPVESRGFNANFYHVKVEGINKLLDIPIDISTQENIEEESTESDEIKINIENIAKVKDDDVSPSI